MTITKRFDKPKAVGGYKIVKLSRRGGSVSSAVAVTARGGKPLRYVLGKSYPARWTTAIAGVGTSPEYDRGFRVLKTRQEAGRLSSDRRRRGQRVVRVKGNAVAEQDYGRGSWRSRQWLCDRLTFVEVVD